MQYEIFNGEEKRGGPYGSYDEAMARLFEMGGIEVNPAFKLREPGARLYGAMLQPWSIREVTDS